MADMKGYSSAKLFAVVCSFAIIGLMTSFYIVEDTFVPFYKRTGPKFTELSAILMASDSTSSYAKMMKPPLETPHDLVRNVSLHCKMVCSENDTPTTNMTFKFQNYNPVVSIATGSNISDNSPVLEADRCSLEEHFPGVELIPRQGSCAVVGNSGILNNSSCGDFIDSHDFVIRANMGLIKGYEVDVGRTSNLNAFNRDLMLIYGSAVGSTRNAKKRKIRNRFLNHIRTLKDSILWYPKQLFQLGGNFVSGKRYRSIINSIRKNGLLDIRFAFSWKPVHVEKEWGLRRTATLGLDMYAVARTFCANITLFGFYPFHKDQEGRDIKYHYFDDVKFNFSLHKGHSWDLEHRKLKELERQGKLTLIVRDCKPRKKT